MEEYDAIGDVVRRVYVGIGSRQTPRAVLRVMAGVAVRLALADVALRSGGAAGADTAFEWGCDQVDPTLKQILLPWPGFNGRQSPFDRPTEAMMDMAAQYHPAWHRCSDAARKLHARNGGQILGPELDARARVVICWTPNGELVGGTAQALRIAADHDVPVINLGDAQWQNANADHIARAALSMLLAERGQTMTLPRVLNQRHHRTGKGTVLIDRTTPWGNPFRIGPDGSRLVVVVKYKRWLPTRPDLMAALGELRGRDLLCWCAPDLCHGNVLMPAADRPR